MASYDEMMNKMRREGMAEQKAKFMSTAATPAMTSMRYGSMTDAEEKAAAAKPAATPMAQAPVAATPAPKARVRGMSDEMTAEYYAPIKSAAPATPPAPAEPSPAETAATRLRNARAELQRLDDIKMFYRTAGAGIGTAVGAGLAGPPGAASGAVIGGMFGDAAGAGPAGDVNMGKWVPQYRPRSKYETIEAEVRDAQRAINNGLRRGEFTQEEIAAHLGLKPEAKP